MCGSNAAPLQSPGGLEKAAPLPGPRDNRDGEMARASRKPDVIRVDEEGRNIESRMDPAGYVTTSDHDLRAWPNLTRIENALIIDHPLRMAPSHYRGRA